MTVRESRRRHVVAELRRYTIRSGYSRWQWWLAPTGRRRVSRKPGFADARLDPLLLDQGRWRPRPLLTAHLGPQQGYDGILWVPDRITPRLPKEGGSCIASS